MRIYAHFITLLSMLIISINKDTITLLIEGNLIHGLKISIFSTALIQDQPILSHFLDPFYDKNILASRTIVGFEFIVSSLVWMSIQRPLSVAEQPLGFWTLRILPPKASIMNRVILKAFPEVHALIQSSGSRKADPSQYTTNLDFYGIMHNLLIYFYSDRVVSEPSSAGIWGRRKRF